MSLSPSNERELRRLCARLRLVMERAERSRSSDHADLRLGWGKDGAIRGDLRCSADLLLDRQQPECFAPDLENSA